MASNPKFDPYAAPGVAEPAPLAGTRDQAMQRLRIGLGGLVGVIILIGLASLIYERANQTDAASVPDAAPTTEPTTAAPRNDPLADAGVVPDLPTEPSPSASPQPATGAGQGGSAQPQ